MRILNGILLGVLMVAIGLTGCHGLTSKSIELPLLLKPNVVVIKTSDYLPSIQPGGRRYYEIGDFLGGNGSQKYAQPKKCAPTSVQPNYFCVDRVTGDIYTTAWAGTEAPASNTQYKLYIDAIKRNGRNDVISHELLIKITDTVCPTDVQLEDAVKLPQANCYDAIKKERLKGTSRTFLTNSKNIRVVGITVNNVKAASFVVQVTTDKKYTYRHTNNRREKVQYIPTDILLNQNDEKVVKQVNIKLFTENNKIIRLGKNTLQISYVEDWDICEESNRCLQLYSTHSNYTQRCSLKDSHFLHTYKRCLDLQPIVKEDKDAKGDEFTISCSYHSAPRDLLKYAYILVNSRENIKAIPLGSTDGKKFKWFTRLDPKTNGYGQCAVYDGRRMKAPVLSDRIQIAPAISLGKQNNSIVPRPGVNDRNSSTIVISTGPPPLGQPSFISPPYVKGERLYGCKYRAHSDLSGGAYMLLNDDIKIFFTPSSSDNSRRSDKYTYNLPSILLTSYEMTGTYKCIIFTGNYMLESEEFVVPKFPEPKFLTQPELSEKSVSKVPFNLVEDQFIQIAGCALTTHFPLKQNQLQWMKDGQMNSEASPRRENTLSPLTFKQIKYSDQGSYQCAIVIKGYSPIVSNSFSLRFRNTSNSLLTLKLKNTWDKDIIERSSQIFLKFQSQLFKEVKRKLDGNNILIAITQIRKYSVVLEVVLRISFTNMNESRKLQLCSSTEHKSITNSYQQFDVLASSYKNIDCCKGERVGDNEHKGSYEILQTLAHTTYQVTCKYNQGSKVHRRCVGDLNAGAQWKETDLSQCASKPISLSTRSPTVSKSTLPSKETKTSTLPPKQTTKRITLSPNETITKITLLPNQMTTSILLPSQRTNLPKSTVLRTKLPRTRLPQRLIALREKPICTWGNTTDCVAADVAVRDLQNSIANASISSYLLIEFATDILSKVGRATKNNNSLLTKSIFSDTLGVVDQLLQAEEKYVAEAQLKSSSSSRLVDALTDLAESSVDFLRKNVSISISTPSVSFRMENVSRNDLSIYHESSSDSGTEIKFRNTTETSKKEPSFFLPSEVFSSEKGIVYSYFFKKASIFLPDKSIISLTYDVMNVGPSVKSNVIWVSVLDRKIDNLTNPVRINLKRKDKNKGNVSCKFWDPKETTSIANMTGAWSGRGCHLINTPSDALSSDALYTCACTHLTSFALLLDINQNNYNPLQLQTVTWIGCGLSMAGLVITLIIFLYFRNLRNKLAPKILINLCLSLIGLLSTFLIGAERTNPRAGCQVIASSIQFFMLSSFCWMLVEGVNIYRLLVKIFATGSVGSFIKQSNLFAWGVPALIVIITASVDPSNLGNEKICVVHGYSFFFGVLLPIALVLVFNFAVLLLSIQNLSHRSVAPKSNTTTVLTQTRVAFTCSVLLGLTWTFGVLAVGEPTEVMQWLFCITSSLQGFFIFVFYVLTNKEVHKEIRDCCGFKQTSRVSTQRVTYRLATILRRTTKSDIHNHQTTSSHTQLKYTAT